MYPISFSAEPLIAANYSFTYVDGTLTVTKGLLTIIANNASRPYGAANPFLSYRVSGFVNGDPPTVVLGTAMVAVWAACALFAQWLAPYDPLKSQIPLLPPLSAFVT